jgi:hypothetical protein
VRVESALCADGGLVLTGLVIVFSCYSVATTSTKPPAVIKADIRRVLDRMQVQYREIKGGFECLHMPSIDLASVIADAQAHQQQQAAGGSDGGGGSGTQDSGSKRILRKASKLSFGPKKKEKDTGSVGEDKQPPTRPAVVINKEDAQGEQQANNVTSVSGGSSSFFNIIPSQELMGDQQQPTEPTEPVVVKANGSTHLLEEPAEDGHGTMVVPQERHDQSLLSPSQSAPAGSNAPTAPRSVSPTRNKFLPPIPRDFAAQHTQEQQKNQGTVTSQTSGGYSAPPTPSITPAPAPPTPGAGITIDDLFEMSAGSELVVRFEINILKVPLLPLHGIQFRRVGGDGWQYQMLARRVLTELKL